MTTPDEVNNFWFSRSDVNGFSDPSASKRWFAGGDAFDQQIALRFVPTIEAALAGRLNHWRATPQGALALILLLDQMTRNVFRRSPRAFAGDAAALACAQQLVQTGHDRELMGQRRVFAYMPFEHAESRIHQATMLGLLSHLRGETPTAFLPDIDEYLRHARQHRAIVQRFGRFPHRNAVLGRIDTPAEAEFLANSSGSFGQ